MKNPIIKLILVAHRRMNLLFMEIQLPISGTTAILNTSIIISMLCIPYNNANSQAVTSRDKTKNFTIYEIYAGSIGTGVPESTQERMRQIEALIATEQSRLDLYYRNTAVGLEGEQQICLILPIETEGQALLNRLHALVKDIPLLSIKATPCSTIRSNTSTDAKNFKIYEIYTSSTGTTIPELTQKRMQQIKALITAKQSRLDLQHYYSTVTGLEGKQRLCLILPAKIEEQTLLDRIRALVKDTPLLNIRSAPCSITHQNQHSH